jgi:hypothetical protein
MTMSNGACCAAIGTAESSIAATRLETDRINQLPKVK